MRANVRALFPVALRVIGSARRRNALLAAVVALSLVFYCGYAVFLDLTYRQSSRLMDQTRLPGDLVLYVPAGIGPNDLSAVRSLYWLRSSEPGVLVTAATSLGLIEVLVLPENSAVLGEIGPVQDGGRTAAGGECLLPVSYRGVDGVGGVGGVGEEAGEEPGGSIGLVPAVGPSGQSLSLGRVPDRFAVAGFYEPRDDWLSCPVLVVGEHQFSAAGRPTALFMWCAHPETFLKPLAAWIENRFIPSEVNGPYLAQRSPLPLLLRSDTAQVWGRDLQRAIYFPAGEAMFLLYIFFAVGLFALMLLSFLDRRRELAVMKTLGLTSPQIALVLYLEVGVVGLIGLAAGTAASVGLLAVARHASGQDLRLSWWVAASGAAFSALSLGLSVWFPIGLARLATVANLLGGQPFHPFGYERRWSGGAAEQAGRAGMGLGGRTPRA
ncbi:MAG: ABC transporter permease [Bacillota bacterium]|nr:ABC transporter permease [Bacillota bacterium]